VSELAATRAALADTRSQLARVYDSPLWRLMEPVRKLRAAKLFRGDRKRAKKCAHKHVNEAQQARATAGSKT
jgi:hypothetical protein